MIRKIAPTLALLLLSQMAIADFIIVPPADRAPSEPIEIRTNQTRSINHDDYTKVSRISEPLTEVGTPVDKPFEPQVYAGTIKIQHLMPELLPDNLAIYIHDVVGANTSVAFSSSNDEVWRDAAKRFAHENNLSIAIDWNQRIAEVLPNGAKLDESAESDIQISDQNGKRYVIRAIEQDHEISKQSGYLFVDGKAIRFDSSN